MGSGKTQNLELIQVEFGKDRYHEQREMVCWCEQHFGISHPFSDSNKRWRWDSMFGSTFFYFKETKDAMIFSLKWS